MRIWFLALISIACNSGEADDDDLQPSMCGLAGTKTGSECSGIDECGTNNAIEPSFCEHCLLRPDTHVCESGTCRALGPRGNIQSAFGIPAQAVGSKSYTVATVQPIMADGSKVTCEKLTTTCGFLDNPAINTTNSTFKNFDGPASIENAYPVLSAAEAGSDQILFLQVTTDVQGKGTVTARGCAEGISVSEGQTTQVPIELMGI